MKEYIFEKITDSNILIIIKSKSYEEAIKTLDLIINENCKNYKLAN